MSLDDCFEKRLLRRTRPDPDKSGKAMEIANKNFGKAEDLAAAEFYEQAIIYTYTAMFQAARALLFSDGIIEKSHYCVIEYLKKNHVGEGKLDQSHIYSIDTYRIERHETLYGLDNEETTEKEARDAIESARSFLTAVENILDGRKKQQNA